jgi:hypothetical protein
MNASRLFILSCSLLAVALPSAAHHSFAAQYDEAHPVSLSGTVTKVTWKNPHVLLSVDVKDDSGTVANWQMELASPNGLLRQGWKLDSVKQGDQVTVNGFAARDGSHVVNARKISLGTPGKVLPAGNDR